MTLEKPRKPPAVNLPLSYPFPRPALVQQTIIWIEPDCMPHCHGETTGVSISFGAGHAAYRVIIHPGVYDDLKSAMKNSERKIKDQPKTGEWIKIPHIFPWWHWRRWIRR